MANATAYNKEKSHKTRSLTLDIVNNVLTGELDWGLEFKKNLVLKLAGGLLPRLNEHTGVDGEQLFPNPILNALFNNNRNGEDSKAEEKD